MLGPVLACRLVSSVLSVRKENADNRRVDT